MTISRRSTRGAGLERRWTFVDAPDSTHPDRATSGDADVWGQWVPAVWRGLSDNSRVLALPARAPADHESACAWWSPMMHLMLYSLAWPSPAVGLEEWVRSRRPLVDRRLSLIEAVWGRHLDVMLHYLWRGCGEYEQRAADALGLPMVELERAFDDLPELTPASTSVPNPATGGCDPLHLSHASIGLEEWREDDVHWSTGDLGVSGPPRALLRCEHYAGWYKALHDLGATLPGNVERQGWRVDVVVEPLGYLGTFRRSRVTGRWFAGQHRWHQLGA